MKYQHKKTGKIGKVVHFKGITTTLRFEDGKEEIITPYNLKTYWKKIEDTEVDKLTFLQLRTAMKEYNLKNDGLKATLSGIIVYSQDNFETEYSEFQRSYRVWNNNKAFRKNSRSKELIGDCLDGTDDDVTLSDYDWIVDYCYIEKGGES